MKIMQTLYKVRVMHGITLMEEFILTLDEFRIFRRVFLETAAARVNGCGRPSDAVIESRAVERDAGGSLLKWEHTVSRSLPAGSIYVCHLEVVKEQGAITGDGMELFGMVTRAAYLANHIINKYFNP